MKHYNMDITEVNFNKLYDRLCLLDLEEKYKEFKKLFVNLEKGSTLIMATGGSKGAAHFLSLVLDAKKQISEVIEPRDFFYKKNIDSYQNLVVISASGTTNGVEESLTHFKGNRFLITENPLANKDTYLSFIWSNSSYLEQKENSFISLVPTLAPMFLFLKWAEQEKSENLSQKMNMLNQAKEEIASFPFSFDKTELLQVMTGYDTKASSAILESNLTESLGLPVILHDKGDFCHGRSNLLYRHEQSPLLYLMHESSSLDVLLLDVLKKEYPNIFVLDTSLKKESSMLEREFYLSLKMYYLSKKIAEDKKMDLTCPDYNPNIVKKVYRYRGEM